MRRRFILMLVFISVGLFAQEQKKSIGFAENKGQIADQKGNLNTDVHYLLNSNGLNVQLRKNGFSYDVYEMRKIGLTKEDRLMYDAMRNFGGKKDSILDYSVEQVFHRVDVEFESSNVDVELIGTEKSKDYDNYYTVRDAPEGVLGVHRFKKVTYRNIYPDVDVVFFVPTDLTKVVEYNFVIRPGGKVGDIKMKFDGVKTELADSKIKMETRFGVMEETLPMSWTEDGMVREDVAVGYKKIRKNVYGFDFDESQISGKTIVIDPVPVRLWGTYYGGNGIDNNFTGFVEVLNDSACLGGSTTSSNNIASSGAYQTSIIGGSDAFLARFDSEGVRLWGTYYGGFGGEVFRAIAFNTDGTFIAVGTTSSSTNIATLGSYQPASGNSNDGMIVKFDANGFRIWGSYYGGSGGEEISCVAIGTDQSIYMGGNTSSFNGISTTGSFKATMAASEDAQGGQKLDGFLLKFSSSGARIWATYYGGNGHESVNCIALDSSGTVFIGGLTLGSATGLSTFGAFMPGSMNLNDFDGFFAKFTFGGQRVFGSYFGGAQFDAIQSIAIDGGDNFIVTGPTRSFEGIATAGAHQTTMTDTGALPGDSFISKFTNDGVQLFSTYYGGDLFDGNNNDLAIGENNVIYFYSYGPSPNNIATEGAYQENLFAGTTLYLVKFTAEGVRLWGTYYGQNCYAAGVAYAGNGTLYITGYTVSAVNIASENSHQPIKSGSIDSFLVKLKDCTTVGIIGSNSPVCTGTAIELIASGGPNYSWTGPNGFTSSLQNPIIAMANAVNNGTYFCIISGIDGCDTTLSVNVIVGDVVAPTGMTIQNFCDSQVLTLADFVVSGTDVTFYDGSVGGNLLPISTTLVNEVTYYASQTLNGCESVSRLALTPDIISGVPANDYAELMCDDLGDGIETVDLSDYNGNLIANDSNYTFKYYTSLSVAENEGNSIVNFNNYTLNTGSNTIYVRIVSASSCFGIVVLDLTVVTLPKLTMKDSYLICENGFVTITADAGFDSYSWSTGATSQAIVVTNGGNYEVTVTKNTNGLVCSSTKNIIVEVSERATITAVETVDWTSNENVITILVDGSGVYEYSVDGINFQSNNQFYGLPNGEYTVYVNDTKGCGVAKKDVYLLMYPKYFTPNEDGYNDFWGIQFYQNEINLVVKIFDRYGKFIKQLNTTDPVWDGTYNGNNLPSTDYWFTVIRQDGTEYKGHFTLKR